MNMPIIAPITPSSSPILLFSPFMYLFDDYSEIGDRHYFRFLVPKLDLGTRLWPKLRLGWRFLTNIGISLAKQSLAINWVRQRRLGTRIKTKASLRFNSQPSPNSRRPQFPNYFSPTSPMVGSPLSAFHKFHIIRIS